jgi:hypothetical protein
MMLLDSEVGPSIMWQEGREGEERLMSTSVKQKENRSWGMLPGDQRRVTSLQRLERPVK